MPTARSAACTALALALLPLAGCGSTPDGEVSAPSREPVAEAVSDAMDASTPDSAVSLLRVTGDEIGSPIVYTLVLITDAASLPAPVAAALKPDFSSESVVFLGMGQQEGRGFATRITGVSRSGDELTVAAEFARPSGEAAGEPTTPWSAAVVPRQEGVSQPLLSDFR